MANTQQKSAKATPTDKRNPSRRNGKAFGKNVDRPARKYSGKTIMGHSLVKFSAMCTKAGFNPYNQNDMNAFIKQRKEERKLNRRTAAEKRAAARQAISRAVNVGMK
jgi:hypothetical protein